jgi:peptidyl-prolyl cis-trans isomerase SurA
MKIKPLFAWLALMTGLTTMASAQGLKLGNSVGSAPSMAADKSAPPVDYIAAVVNSEPITDSEVRARIARVMQQINQQGASAPPPAELRKQVLERLISEKAQLQEAKEEGIKVEEGAITQAEENVARQNRLTLPDLRNRLRQEGVSETQLRSDLRDQLLMTRLRERMVEPRVKISDWDIDNFLKEQQRQAAVGPLELNLAQILVVVPESANAEEVARLEAKAKKLLEQVKSGAELETVAKQANTPTEKVVGGVMGLRSSERYPELFVTAVRALGVGGVAGPVRSGAGFHILKVVEKHDPNGLPETVKQSHARHILLKTSAKLSEADAINQLNDFRRRLNARQANFADLAKEFSQDGSAPNGGDLGWANPGQFVPEFEEVMNSLAPGDISRPVVTRFGVHLIQLQDRREVPLSERDRREIARYALKEKKTAELYATYLQDLRDRAYVELRDAP